MMKRPSSTSQVSAKQPAVRRPLPRCAGSVFELGGPLAQRVLNGALGLLAMVEGSDAASAWGFAGLTSTGTSAKSTFANKWLS